MSEKTPHRRPATFKLGDPGVIVMAPDETGRPARGMVNRIMRELGPMSNLAPAFPLATGAIAPLRAKAESLGNLGSGDFSPLWSGQNASGCRDIGAAQMTKALVALLKS